NVAAGCDVCALLRTKAKVRAPGPLKSDGFQLTVLGDYGAHYRIDGSSDFSTWTPLGTVTNVFGAAVFSDPAAPSIAYRFYRAVQVP
ncbi:MAG TPA: hypothetical protein VGY98_06600, partial [Verrucomicrobiae bacterium]|nr:hypothetical protein [Verrucomicrobiae bacterium]